MLKLTKTINVEANYNYCSINVKGHISFNKKINYQLIF